MTARLPIKDALLALALHTAGHPSTPEITYHVDEGNRQHLTYWVHGDPVGAQALLASLNDSKPEKNLQRNNPTHPFLACRHAIEAFGTVSKWLSGAPMAIPSLLMTTGPLRRVVEGAGADYDVMRVIWRDGTIKPRVRVWDAPFATALAVCGFPLWPELLPPGDGKAASLVFAEESLTFPGLTHTILAQYVQPGIQVGPLPGHWQQGEHPFDYAYQAAVNASRHPLFLAAAAKRPQIFLKGPGTGGIIASQSLFDESNRNSAFRDRAHSYLAGEG